MLYLCGNINLEFRITQLNITLLYFNINICRIYRQRLSAEN